MSQTLDTVNTYPINMDVTGGDVSYRTKETQFGDGYIERALDGINYETGKYTIEFLPLEKTAFNTLKSLLLNSVNGTSNCLSWTPPDDTTSAYWVAKSISYKTFAPSYYIISCTLERIYPLG